MHLVPLATWPLSVPNLHPLQIDAGCPIQLLARRLTTTLARTNHEHNFFNNRTNLLFFNKKSCARQAGLVPTWLGERRRSVDMATRRRINAEYFVKPISVQAYLVQAYHERGFR